MRRWTPEDDQKLRELVASRPKLTASEIAMRLGRNRHSVIGRCNRIGLALPNAGIKVNHAARTRPIERKPKPAAEPRLRRKKTKPLDSLKRGKWSDEEVAELRRLVAQRPRLSAVEIAYKLNREADSVRGALKEHGLSLRGPAGSPAVVCKASLRLPPNDERKPASEPKRSKSKGPKSKRQKPKTQPERLKTQPEKPRSQPATRFADLAAHQCRFPVGNDQPGPDMACCGQAVVDITATTGLRATHCADCLKKMVAPAWQ